MSDISLNKKRRYNRLYMDIATRVSEMSHAIRAKVGAVIVKDDNIISFGWNGTPAGMDNTCETIVQGSLVTKSEVQHAEENAILKLAKQGNSCAGADIYLTLSPCVQCAKMIYGAGIKNVFYRDYYQGPSVSGINFLDSVGVNCDQFIDV